MRPVRRSTFSEPTSAVAEGLRDHVGLVAARVEPQLALVVVGLPVAAAHRHRRHVRRARGRTDAVHAADLRAVAARVALQLVAARWYGRYHVRCGAKRITARALPRGRTSKRRLGAGRSRGKRRDKLGEVTGLDFRINRVFELLGQVRRINFLLRLSVFIFKEPLRVVIKS